MPVEENVGLGIVEPIGEALGYTVREPFGLVPYQARAGRTYGKRASNPEPILLSTTETAINRSNNRAFALQIIPKAVPIHLFGTPKTR